MQDVGLTEVIAFGVITGLAVLVALERRGARAGVAMAGAIAMAVAAKWLVFEVT